MQRLHGIKVQIGAPLGGILVIVQIAPASDCSAHAGVAARFDVAHMIPHIEAVSCFDPQLFAGKIHGGWVGLAYRQGIGTDGNAAAGQFRQSGQ